MDAKRAARKSKRGSNAPKRRFPQREIRRAATAARSCFISNGKFTQAKRSWQCLTRKRRARPVPKVPRTRSPSQGGFRGLLGQAIERFSRRFRWSSARRCHAEIQPPPRRERLGIETAPAVPIGVLRPESLAARPWIYAVFSLYMPLRVDRPDQRIANESGEEEAGKHPKDLVVDMIAWNALRHERGVEVIGDYRTFAAEHASQRAPASLRACHDPSFRGSPFSRAG